MELPSVPVVETDSVCEPLDAVWLSVIPVLVKLPVLLDDWSPAFVVDVELSDTPVLEVIDETVSDSDMDEDVEPPEDSDSVPVIELDESVLEEGYSLVELVVELETWLVAETVE